MSKSDINALVSEKQNGNFSCNEDTFSTHFKWPKSREESTRSWMEFIFLDDEMSYHCKCFTVRTDTIFK